ncbi:hypothetical protein [Blastomonas aquatica]|uniref:Uncharacterized protein n=1 Tax=Blastomonas aquatica TaxID=1510276 RepID=A0ABQ1ITK5_9SPHN|nr:hypothetical protein [Blastomonas aquatica]GGB51653.1 hypothetical protein GCM10010833_02990 [Blastomonas aquatica]
MNLMLLFASLAAILAVAGLVWLLQLGESKIGSAGDAARIAEEQIAGFEAGPVLMSENGEAALIEGADGRIVLLKRHGAHCAGRVLQRPLRAHRCNEGWKVETGDPRFGHVALALSKQDGDKLLTMM